MPPAKLDLILQSECARRLNVTQASVKGWLDTGKVRGYADKQGRTMVDWNKCQHIKPRRALADRPKFTPPEDQDDGEGFLDHAKAKLKRETFLAHTAELEFKKASGELVSAADVAKQWEGIAANVRRRLMILPDRLAPLLAAETDPRKLHTMLTEELHRALETLNQDPEEEMEFDHGSDEPSQPG